MNQEDNPELVSSVSFSRSDRSDSESLQGDGFVTRSSTTKLVPEFLRRERAGQGPRLVVPTSHNEDDVEINDEQASLDWITVRGKSAWKRQSSDEPAASTLEAATTTTFEPVTASENQNRVIGFLVSYDYGSAGEVHILRVGRWVVTSGELAVSGPFIVIDDPSISPFHATLRIDPDGTVHFLDQFSENGTAVRRADGTVDEVLQGGTIENGDSIKFGDRRFYLCIVTAATKYCLKTSN